ncbi:MAG TPA: hypothetical protein VJ840_10035 [Gemmatimonadaceae bacterium]|nr:hypothetical protein [Gemmatimonadaceae bacterium]
MIAASAAVVSSAAAQQQSQGNILAGAQAIITPNEARFIFPRQSPDSYVWDVPIPGVSGGGGFAWDVSWETPPERVGIDPCELWLAQWWKSGGPRKGGLKDLLQWLRLQPMIKDTTLSGAHAMRKTDYRNVFATVENGQLVFIVRGAEAVQKIFPTIPSKVRFRAYIAEPPERNYGVSSNSAVITVPVNGQASAAALAPPRRCDNISDGM